MYTTRQLMAVFISRCPPSPHKVTTSVAPSTSPGSPCPMSRSFNKLVWFYHQYDAYFVFTRTVCYLKSFSSEVCTVTIAIWSHLVAYLHHRCSRRQEHHEKVTWYTSARRKYVTIVVFWHQRLKWELCVIGLRSDASTTSVHLYSLQRTRQMISNVHCFLFPAVNFRAF